jgi:hypothetical protein
MGCTFGQVVFGRVAVLAVLAAVLASPAAAATQAGKDAAAATRGINQALIAGRLDAEQAGQYRASVARALQTWNRLPGDRATNLAGALHDAAALANRYDAPRALTLFGTLDANTDYLGTKAAPRSAVDIQDADGVVYRWFPGHGFQFHPLANASKLSNLAPAFDSAPAASLAVALLDRAEPTANGGLMWEYLFPFGGGKPSWTSGMAEAAFAQAYSRVATNFDDPTYLETAAKAFTAARALTRQLPVGPWVRLYSFSSLAVLNAQLQTSLSIAEYARTSGDANAVLFADKMMSSAAAMLPQFDSGSWSLYSLGGTEASLHYHSYVVDLLNRLSQLDDRPEWLEYATIFGDDLTTPPDVTPVSVEKVVYPVPRDGFRDQASVTFQLSKTATVRLAVAGERRPYTLRPGRHTLTWDPGTRPARAYAAKLVATDVAGNTAEVPVGPFEVRRDTTPPDVSATLAGDRVTWTASDDETPWLHVRLRFSNGAGSKTLDLGKRRLNGSAKLKVPAGRWGATLLAGDSTGNTTSVSLGYVEKNASSAP